MSTVAAPVWQRPRFIAALLPVHAEELEFLWAQRRAAMVSDTRTLRDLARIDERVEAHTQGLLVAGDALLAFAEPQLAAADRATVFAAAYPVARSGITRGLHRLLDGLRSAQEPALAGLRDALGLAPIDAAEAALRALLAGTNPLVAASAAHILASHQRLDPASPHLTALLHDGDPAGAVLAWHAVALLKPSPAAPVRPYVAALAAAEPPVRHAALRAALWQGESWVAAKLRQLAHSGVPEALPWLAATAGPEAVTVFAALIAPGRRSPTALALAGRFGHPDMIEPLLESLSDPDPQVAHAAGKALTRITGLALEGTRWSLPAEHAADDFSREFSTDMDLADPGRTRELVRGVRTAWKGGTRWCRGHDVTCRLDRDARHGIDLQALWDFGARAALLGQRPFGPPPEG